MPTPGAHIHNIRLVLAARGRVVDADEGTALGVQARVVKRQGAHHGARDGDDGVVGVGGEAAGGVRGGGVGG